MACLLAILTLVLVTNPSQADQKNDDLAIAARKVLKKHCLSCHHGEGSESGEAFHVLEHASLLKEKGEGDKPILRGKSLESRLWVRAGDKKTMPPKSIKDRPTPEELETLKAWIDVGAPAYPDVKARAFISTHTQLKMIYDHLASVDPDLRPYLRYFTFTHLFSNPAVSDEDLRIAKAALSKAINSMSRSPRITVPKAVDKDETIFVIDLRDFDWHKNQIWDEILRLYPYGLDYRGSDDEKMVTLQKNLDTLTHRELVYLRADWFIATATRPPLYYTLLQLPDNSNELKRWLQIDFHDNFRNDKLARAGFQSSGVSRQNRLVERQDSPVGVYYWESYDFKPRQARSSLTRFPLGPVFPGNSYDKQAFIHAGGEMIYGLPNGLQGYFLVDGKGKRIDEGPVDVVSDKNMTSGAPAIVVGTSCMNCHKYGAIGFTDTIRNGNALFGNFREKVKRLYPEQETMDQWVKSDQERFVRALEKTTGPFLKVNEDKNRPIRDFGELIGEVTSAYLLTDVSLEKAAYELGIEKPETLAGMIKGNPRLKEYGVLPLANGKVLKRDDWEVPEGTSLFQDVASALGLGMPIMPHK